MVLAVLFVLIVLVVPMINVGPTLKSPLWQSASNARQILLAAMQMANDGVATAKTGGPNNPNLAWPGDLAKRTPNPVSTINDYFEILIKEGYLTPSDVIKITAAPGITPWNGVKRLDGNANIAFKIYRITEADGASNLFAATRNFTYGSPLSASQQPYQNKGFVVVQKNGSAITLSPDQAESLPLIGLLPGRQTFTDRPVEEANHTLIQK